MEAKRRYKAAKSRRGGYGLALRPLWQGHNVATIGATGGFWPMKQVATHRNVVYDGDGHADHPGWSTPPKNRLNSLCGGFWMVSGLVRWSARAPGHRLAAKSGPPVRSVSNPYT